MHVLLHSMPPSAAAHHRPMPPPETPVHSWASLDLFLMGHCSFLLGPGAHKLLFLSSKSMFPQLCVSSGGSMVGKWRPPPGGLMLYPGLLHPEPLPLQQSTADLCLHRRHSNTVLTQSLWGLWVLVCIYIQNYLESEVCPGGSEVKASACNVGDLGLIPGSRRSPGEGNGNPLQYSCLENPMDGEDWRSTVHRVAKSQTQLRDFTSLYNIDP